MGAVGLVPALTLIEFKRAIQADSTLSRLLAWLKEELSREKRSDAAHDLDHLFRVALWTVRLGEGKLDFRSAVAASLLHDLVSLPKSSTDRSRASELCSERVREILPRFGYSEPAISEICDAIRTHSYSRGEEPRSLLGECLQDADRLEALGAIGLYRVIATGLAMGGEFFEPADPWAQGRALDDRRYWVDHFFTKLLRLPSAMRTAAGRAEAARRGSMLQLFLSHLGEEIGMPLPDHVV